MVLLATLLLAFEPRIKQAIMQLSHREPATEDSGNILALAGVVFIGAFYGGFFGAGRGIVVLALLGLVMSETLTRINAVKLTISLLSSVTAALLFLGSNLIEWPAAIALGIGSFVGGEFGGLFASKVNPDVLRIVVVVLGLAISIAFFIKHY